MRFSVLLMVLIAVAPTPGQSGRVVPGSGGSSASTTPSVSAVELTVKQMFEEANLYILKKGAEFDAKKIFVTDTLLKQTKLEQRQLAARYALVAGARKDLAGEDLYYLGRLHYLAENRDGTVETLARFLETGNPPADRSQGARSLIVVSLAKQNKTEAAEKMLAEYLGKEPVRLTERARMEGELAKAYQAQKDHLRMAPHAEQSYKAAKELLEDAASHARGLDEILEAG